ncbi:uncharacterized protein UTRI_04611_B [Ustilago trichophora]|uniref:Nuclear fusion protein KAR5 n=1 Tax=Ustilago trichophora TaxID=86804 RepID=A0A5C3EBX6_9BASI|nr:uncharacterized protein UTRI_04611_B [Ustilago trichophora]
MMRFSRLAINSALYAVALLSSQVNGVPSFFRREVSSTPTSHPPSGSSGIDTLNLTSSERIALFGGAGLAEGHASQQCYSLIYDQVKAGCARDSDMHPSERMLALLTICDLRASNQSIPWECEAAQNSADVFRTEEATLGSCVEALSRSNRYWSSYSGYLREIPQMCFAMQRWKDTDRARDLYKAATHEKIALLRFWRQNVQDAAEASNADRLERQEWLRELSLFKANMQLDLQTILSDFTASLERRDESEKDIVDLAQSIKASQAHAPHREAVELSLIPKISALEDATLQLSETLSLQMSAYLENIMAEHSQNIEQAVHHHLSTASEVLETRLVASINAVNQQAFLLQMHTDALQLALQNQHGLVSVLVSASDEMLHRQQAHDEQLSTEIDALRQLQSGFQSIEQDMNATYANIGSLLLSHGSRWSIWNEALFSIERLFVELTHGFFSGANLNHFLVLRCLHWLLPALLTGTLLLARLHKNILVFFYSRSMSWIRGQSEAKETTDRAPDLEPSMSDSWFDMTTPPFPSYRTEIAARNAIPYETRKKGQGRAT